jgi:hypothetical protein
MRMLKLMLVNNLWYLVYTTQSCAVGGPQGCSGRVHKISPPTGIRSPDSPAPSRLLYRPPCDNVRMHRVNVQSPASAPPSELAVPLTIVFKTKHVGNGSVNYTCGLCMASVHYWMRMSWRRRDFTNPRNFRTWRATSSFTVLSNHSSK